MNSFKSKNCACLIGVRSLLVLFIGLLAVFAAQTLTVRAATTDDLQIYCGRYNNGWGDWGYVPHLGTNSPVFTNTPVYVSSNQMTMPVGTTDGSVFFRLVRPY